MRYGQYCQLNKPQTYPNLSASYRLFQHGADERVRTADPRFTKAMLYQLSYIGITPAIITDKQKSASTLSHLLNSAKLTE